MQNWKPRSYIQRQNNMPSVHGHRFQVSYVLILNAHIIQAIYNVSQAGYAYVLFVIQQPNESE